MTDTAARLLALLSLCSPARTGRAPNSPIDSA